jgi:hypothetical protein
MACCTGSGTDIELNEPRSAAARAAPGMVFFASPATRSSTEVGTRGAGGVGNAVAAKNCSALSEALTADRASW